MYIVAHNEAPIFGGCEIFTTRLLAGLQRRGHRVLLLCRNRKMAGTFGAHGVPTGIARLGGDLMFPNALRFAWILRKHRPDVLLLTTFTKVWLGGLGARLAGVPRVVARIPASYYRPKRWKYRFALERWVHVVVLNADAMRAGFLEAAPQFDARRLVTIHNGVRVPERLQPPGTLRRSLGLPEQARVVGTLARLEPQKRLDRLLRALALLPESVHCVIAGEGYLRATLERLAEDLGVRSRLHLLGFRTDTGDVLEAFDVLVVSSDAEGMSNAMLEAMAAGVPVVSTAVSGASEALEPLPDGAAPGEVVGFEPVEMAEALQRLLSDPDRRSQMSAAAVRRVEERFGFERMLDQWEALFSRLS